MKSALGNKEIMAENIKRYMKLHGLNIRQLSDKIETPYTTVADWVKGKTYPRIVSAQQKIGSRYEIRSRQNLSVSIGSIIHYPTFFRSGSAFTQ